MLAFVAVSACAAGAPPSTSAQASVLPGKPVARVNSAVLTDRDLLREMYAIFPYARVHNGFPKAMEADIRRGAMKMMVFEELVYQEAQRRKMTVAPARLDRAVAQFRKQFVNADQYQDFVRTELNGSANLLRSRVRRSLLIDQFLKLEVANKAAVSLADAKTYFEKNPDRFRIPEAFVLQTISILPPANATAAQMKEARKQAEEALAQARATKNYEEFGLLAEKISQDDYRVMMGDHKAVDRTKLPPEVVQAVQGMQKDQVSGLIQVGQAFTIIRLNGHVSAGMQKFADVKDSLRKQLTKEKTEHLRSALDRKLRASSKVEEL